MQGMHPSNLAQTGAGVYPVRSMQGVPEAQAQAGFCQQIRDAQQAQAQAHHQSQQLLAQQIRHRQMVQAYQMLLQRQQEQQRPQNLQNQQQAQPGVQAGGQASVPSRGQEPPKETSAASKRQRSNVGGKMKSSTSPAKTTATAHTFTPTSRSAGGQEPRFPTTSNAEALSRATQV
ncbi:unnamed protein product [Agarophyton chilense]